MSNECISLAAGVIIEKSDSIVMVKENGKWGLPKGKREQGETFEKTAKREAKEETGLEVEIVKVAFITEFIGVNSTYYLQVFYEAKIIGGIMQPNDPDEEIEAVRYVKKSEISKRMKFRPRLIPLENWLQDREIGYHTFDLKKEEQFIH